MRFRYPPGPQPLFRQQLVVVLDNLLLVNALYSCYIVYYFSFLELEAADKKIEDLETEVDRIKEEKREQSLGKQ